MSETHYSLAVIRAAFWETFHESGERWFSYLMTPEQNATHTEHGWEEFAENLATAQRERLAPAIAAIRALEGVVGHLHNVLDDENYEDGNLLYCKEAHAENSLDMSDEQLILEFVCMGALWPLTPHEREMANEQAEAEECEAFYQQHPERRP